MKTKGELLTMEPTPLDAGEGRNGLGTICAANDARFDETFYNEPLTEYVIGGWDRDPLQEMLDFYFPAITTPRRTHYKEAVNKEQFYADANDDDIREMGQDFRNVREYTMVERNVRVPNKGLTIAIDRDEATPMAERRAVDRLTRRLLRNELVRAINLLDAAATNRAVTWDATAGKDPDQDVRSDIILAADSSGLRPNSVGWGETAWSKRVLAHRAQNSAGGFASAGMTPEVAASSIGVQRGASNAEARYQGASNLSQVVGNLVFMFYAEPGMSVDEPSNTKRFVSEVEGGGMVRVYRHVASAKRIEISVEHYSLPLITSTLGIRKLTVS